MRTHHTLLLLSLGGCLAVEPPADEGSDSALRLVVTDWSGDLASADTIPRRPRLQVHASGPIATDNEPVMLLSGPSSAALIDDLVRAPLRREHEALRIACAAQPNAQGVTLVPFAALDANREHTLAIGAWARTERGADVVVDDEPIVMPLHTASGPEAGARVLGSWPADGSSAVSIALEEALVVLDGHVDDEQQGVWLQGPDALAVPANVELHACDVRLGGARGSHCVHIRPHGVLAANARYSLHVGAAARDAHGAPVGAWQATFTTTDTLDVLPPRTLAQTCDIDERTLDVGCALVDDDRIVLRTLVDEPVIFELRVDGRAFVALAPMGSAEMTVEALGADRQVEMALVAHDAAGNAMNSSTFVRTEAPLATLSITEVRADPRGPEPAQEYVELWNYGGSAIDLQGFALSDRRDEIGDPIASNARVAPDARVLLVADSFDELEPSDSPPPPGTLLVRHDGPLTGSGLLNRGEALFLRDAQGRRISAAPARPKTSAGGCLVRVSEALRDGAVGTFVANTDDGCTPGR